MRYLFIFSVFLGLSACAQDKEAAKNNVAPQEAAQMIEENPEMILLDVRTPQEFNSGHLAEARHIDFYADDFANQLEKLDSSKRYVVYCRSGGRSSRAAKMMREMGFATVSNLEGGILAWQRAKLPLKK